jgi:hypothetical protein
LVLSSNKIEFNGTLFDMLLDGMIAEINVFGFAMMNGVAGNGNGTFGIALDWNLIE